MKLSLPCNWDPALIDRTGDLPVYDFYGAMNTTPFGHARSAFIIPEVPESSMRLFIDKAHERGRRFSYVMNAPNMSNREFDPQEHGNILSYLHWLVHCGVDTVHVSNPYLMEVVLEQFPDLEVNASVVCGICSADMARAYERMGVATMNVGLESNRDFAALRAMRKAVKVPLIVIPNLADLRGCPYRTYHYSLLGYTTQQHQTAATWRSWAMDPCILQCNERKLTAPVELIKSCFVRPEDLHHYEQAGITICKISGRHQNTEWIVRAATAYADGAYPGNLVDILDTVIINTNHIQQLHMEFIGKSDPEILAVPAFYAWGSMHYNVSEVVQIDGSKLDGFITHFVENGCNPARLCSECGYCAPWAEKAVTVNSELAEKYLTVIRNHRKALRNSDFAVRSKT